jgi:hypothetical protein
VSVEARSKRGDISLAESDALTDVVGICCCPTIPLDMFRDGASRASTRARQNLPSRRHVAP